DREASWSAFDASERGRARSLRYALNQETRTAASGLLVPSAHKYRQLVRDLVHLPQPAPTPGRWPALVDAIDRAAAPARGPTDSLDRAELARTLLELNATLVEYAVGARDMFAFIVSADAARVVRLGDARQIASAAAEFRDRLRDPETPQSEIRETARKLARIV